MSKLSVAKVQQTIARIKAIEPGMYLTYTFPDMPDGIFFIYQGDLLPLAERYEAYEAALLEIHALDNCNHIRTTAAEVLGEVLNSHEEPGDINVEEFDDLWNLTGDDDFSDEVLLELNNDELF